jgi:hypothetical protein
MKKYKSKIMNVFFATTNNLTQALNQVWDDWDPYNEPDVVVLLSGKTYRWDATAAHYLCAKGRISEKEYAARFFIRKVFINYSLTKLNSIQ